MPLGNLTNTIASLGPTITNTTQKTLNTMMGFKNQGSAAANAVSRAAQENQFAFNSAEAAINREYNTQMWEEQKNFNSAEAAKAREFNANEAEKNRQWQERLANTSYQRAIEDLKKAGLNPILAYMNGATTPAGGAASGAAANAGLASGSPASGSNYTGQGANMSDSLALFGAIGTMLGETLSALATYMGTTGRDYGILSASAEKQGLFTHGRKPQTNNYSQHWSPNGHQNTRPR